MTQSHVLRYILSPMEFFRGGVNAFAHALRIAAAKRGARHVLHVEAPQGRPNGSRFPKPQARALENELDDTTERAVHEALCRPLAVP